MSKIEDLHAERTLILKDLLRRSLRRIVDAAKDDECSRVVLNDTGGDHHKHKTLTLSSTMSSVRILQGTISYLTNDKKMQYDLDVTLYPSGSSGARIRISARSIVLSGRKFKEHSVKFVVQGLSTMKSPITADQNPEYTASCTSNEWGFFVSDSDSKSRLDIPELFDILSSRVDAEECRVLVHANASLKSLNI